MIIRNKIIRGSFRESISIGDISYEYWNCECGEIVSEKRDHNDLMRISHTGCNSWIARTDKYAERRKWKSLGGRISVKFGRSL
ncbi:hypothetical protein BNJ_00018 [Kaumoebavirus]|uniref:hypothetical protein n=1 Tax=Kaumoebavirus TaxID=1859492 RepID=UPI0009C3CF58|nr:hypothetical protein BNJ_00018 [Kaumoebavirus]ARA71862.1 hypothetical protein BNJ_00018 [Kaumoebavirus]